MTGILAGAGLTNGAFYAPSARSASSSNHARRGYPRGDQPRRPRAGTGI